MIVEDIVIESNLNSRIICTHRDSMHCQIVFVMSQDLHVNVAVLSP
jgi:hypothetical protein